MQLIMNVDCTDTAECARAGATLVNTTSQTRLTDGLAKGRVSLQPGTIQVGGVMISDICDAHPTELLAAWWWGLACFETLSN